MGTGSSGSGSRGLSGGKHVTDYDGSRIDMSHAPLKYGKHDRTMTTPVRDAVDRFEEKRMRNKIEYGCLVDERGNVISERKGGKGSVRMYNRDYEKAVVMTHIHPREAGMLGGSFSREDIDALIKFPKLMTMRAVAKEGTYSLSKGKGFNSTGFQKYFSTHYDQNRAEYSRKAKALTADYRAGKIDYSTYSKAFDREFNKYLSDNHKMILDGQKKFGYTYTLERRKK